MLGALILYLVLELGLFLVVKVVLHATAHELAGPFLAYAVPGATLLPFAWWLRKWEGHSPPPKRLALGWSLCVALISSLIGGAFYYSGVHLHLLNPKEVISFVVEGLAGVLTTSVSMYYMVLPRIAARAKRNRDDARRK
jgi:fluoride ion exporter CrcB/FEX